jgi:hypothetical protein
MKGSAMTGFDAYSFTDGLVTEYQGKITDAYFTYDDSYNDGESLLLKLEIQTDNSELGDGGAVIEQYPVGKGWETTDTGKTASREDGKPKALNKNSGVAVLVTSAIEAGAAAELKSRGIPTDSAIWPGLEFTFARKEFTFKVDGEERSYGRMLITEYHGHGLGAAGGAVKPGKAEKGEKGENAVAGPIPPKVKIQLKKLAMECDTHDEFIERAFVEIDGVDGDSVVESTVMDANGLYADARN